MWEVNGALQVEANTSIGNEQPGVHNSVRVCLHLNRTWR